jgi:hypothetical protein
MRGRTRECDVHIRDLALVGVRIVAIYVAAQALAVYAPTAMSTFWFDPFDTVQKLSTILLLLFPLITAALLWVFAPRIAALASDGCKEQGLDGDSSPSALVTGGLILIGAYLLATTLPRILGTLPRVFAGETANALAQLAADALICAFAVIMVFGATGLARGILMLRRAGSK